MVEASVTDLRQKRRIHEFLSVPDFVACADVVVAVALVPVFVVAAVVVTPAAAVAEVYSQCCCCCFCCCCC